MIVREAIAVGEELLRGSGVENCVNESRWLLCECLGVRVGRLNVMFDEELSDIYHEKYMKMVSRRMKGEPLQYVIGNVDFWDLRLFVGPGVLIPRPETEELVGRAIDFAQAALLGKVRESVAGEPQCPETAPQCQATHPLRILDVCTGSGCIAWSIAASIPQAEVYACDISRQALQIARSQSILTFGGTSEQEKCGIPARVHLFECDILSREAEQTILSQCTVASATGDAVGTFDIIVSNPPYVCESEKSQMRANVLDHEPHLALFVPDNDPLKFYRTIAQLSGRILKPGGALMFEINERFGQETKKILQDLGFENCQVVQDIFGKERMVVGYKNFS